MGFLCGKSALIGTVQQVGMRRGGACEKAGALPDREDVGGWVAGLGGCGGGAGRGRVEV